MKSLCQAEQQREIVSRLQRVSETQTPRWGRMHAGAMLRHLREAYEISLCERQVQSVKSILRTPPGRFLALYSGVPWAHGFRTLPEIDILLKPESIGEFAVEKAELIALIDRFCRSDAGDLLSEHPFFGNLTRDDWMRWGYLQQVGAVRAPAPG